MGEALQAPDRRLRVAVYFTDRTGNHAQIVEFLGAPRHEAFVAQPVPGGKVDFRDLAIRPCPPSSIRGWIRRGLADGCWWRQMQQWQAIERARAVEPRARRVRLLKRAADPDLACACSCTTRSRITPASWRLAAGSSRSSARSAPSSATTSPVCAPLTEPLPDF